MTFSGDKLLGGPQAGLLAGRYHVISALKKHPLARAVRLDKMTLAALEQTLRLYLDPVRAVEQIPTLRMLVDDQDRGRRAGRAARRRASRGPARAPTSSARPTTCRGPAAGRCRWATSQRWSWRSFRSAWRVVELERALRLGEPHIIARISEDRLLLDPRTLSADDDARGHRRARAHRRAGCGLRRA